MTNPGHASAGIIPAIVLGCLAPLLLLCIAPGVRSDQRARIDPRFAGVSVDGAKQAFSMSGTDEDLLMLLMALCYREQQGQDVGQDLAIYGDALLSRAKVGLIDLERAVPDQEQMLTMLTLIHGAIADREKVGRSEADR